MIKEENNNQDNSLSTEDWSSLFVSLVSNRKEALINNLIAYTGWPSKEVFLSSLSNINSLGPDPLTMVRDRSEDVPLLISSINADRLLKSETLKNSRSDWWAMCFSKFSIDIDEINKANPSLLDLFAYSRFDNAISMAVANTKDDYLDSWLRSYTKLSFQISDRLSELTALVSYGNFKVLDQVKKKSKDWVNIPDQRGRTPIFFSNSANMISYLLESGADIKIENHNGEKATDYWIKERQSKFKKSWLDTVSGFNIDKGLVDKNDQINGGMVFKLFSLSPSSFNDEEISAFDVACKSMATWKWDGKLSGVERTWTLPEIWKFGELMMSIGQINRPAESSFRPYGSPSDYIKAHPHLIMGALANLRSLIPNRILKDVLLDRSRNTSMSEKIFTWLIGWGEANKPSNNAYNVPVYAKEKEKKVGLFSNVEKLSIFSPNQQYLSFLPSLDKDSALEWAKEMKPIWSNSWLYEGILGDKMRQLMELSALPQSIGGLALKENSSVWSNFKQNEGFRSFLFADIWIRRFYDIIPILDDNGDIDKDELEPILRVGLMAMGCKGSSYMMSNGSTQLVDEKLSSFIESGVPMEKVPAYWRKNYSPTLKAAVDKWSISLHVDKKIKRKKPSEQIVTRAKRKI